MLPRLVVEVSGGGGGASTLLSIHMLFSTPVYSPDPTAQDRARTHMAVHLGHPSRPLGASVRSMAEIAELGGHVRKWPPCIQFWEFLDQKRGSAVANGSCKAIATLVGSLHTTWVACELKAHRAIVLHMNAYKNIQRILRFRTRRF